MIDIGCGVGFLGISCAVLGAKKVVLTDGNTDVLTMAKENIGYSKKAPPVVRSVPRAVSDLTELNSLYAQTQLLAQQRLAFWIGRTSQKSRSQHWKPRSLFCPIWYCSPLSFAMSNVCVYVISHVRTPNEASHILGNIHEHPGKTYDPTNIVPLVTVLKAILVKGVSAYMSSAIRNPQTFVDFFARISKCHVRKQVALVYCCCHLIRYVHFPHIHSPRLSAPLNYLQRKSARVSRSKRFHWIVSSTCSSLTKTLSRR